MNVVSNRITRKTPIQGLWGGGYAHGALNPESIYKNSVGSYKSTVTQYGEPTLLTDNLYFHVLAYQLPDQSEEASLEVWISVGDTIDKVGGTGADTASDWVESYGYNTFNLKKSNNGSFFTGAINYPLHKEGNAVKIHQGTMWVGQYESLILNPTLYWGVFLSTDRRVVTKLASFRDCKLIITTDKDDYFRVGWKGIYNWESNGESLWVQDNNGFLLHQILISEDNEEGFVDIPIYVGQIYHLVIPGYSYRNYYVSVSEETSWLLEPTKLHFSGWTPKDATYYFKVYPGEEATFCMKDYNRGSIQGTYGARLTALEDENNPHDMVLRPKTYHYEFDTVVIPPKATPQTWRVDIKGEGRMAFWLDGIPNFFSDRPSKYNRPVLDPGRSTIMWPSMDPANSIGFYPNVGHYMPYAIIPTEFKPLFSSFKAQCMNIYTMADAIMRETGIQAREEEVRRYMSEDLGLERDYTILANSGRVAVVDFVNDPNIAPAMDFWINNIADLNDGKEHYIAAADEPNLNYPDYATFAAHFEAFATFFRNHPRSEGAGIKISAMASSRFDRGTTIADSVERKGELWLSRLIETHGEFIDAIVWHDWTVRGLLNLRQYSETIEAAYKYSNNGQRRLSIEQTNTSGGSSVSLYDNNTHFACLWWASVFVNSARTGKLDDLMWFPTVDDPTHPKGLVYGEDDPNGISLKLVGKFHIKLMEYIYGYTNKKVFNIELPHIELDAVLIQNSGGDVLIAVNKGKRNHTLSMQGFDWTAAETTVRVVNDNHVLTSPTLTVVPGEGGQIIIPPEGILFMSRGTFTIT